VLEYSYQTTQLLFEKRKRKPPFGNTVNNSEINAMININQRVLIKKNNNDDTKNKPTKTFQFLMKKFSIFLRCVMLK